MTEFIMKELDNGKIKSVYKRFIKPVFKEKKMEMISFCRRTV